MFDDSEDVNWDGIAFLIKGLLDGTGYTHAAGVVGLLALLAGVFVGFARAKEAWEARQLLKLGPPIEERRRAFNERYNASSQEAKDLLIAASDIRSAEEFHKEAQQFKKWLALFVVCAGFFIAWFSLGRAAD